MNFGLIITIILFIVGAFFAFKLIKSLIKALFLVSMVAIILVALTSFFIYKDITDFRDNWPSSEKLFLMESEDNLVTGFISNFSDAKKPVFLSDEQITFLRSNFGNNDFKSMLGDNYKILIMNLDIIVDEIETDEISLGDITLTKQDIVLILNSDNPSDLLIDKFMESRGYSAEQRTQLEESVESDIGDGAKIKAITSNLLVSQLFMEKGSQSGLFIFQQYKSGNIIIYPETAIFKIIKLMPNFVINMAGSIAEKTVKGEE